MPDHPIHDTPQAEIYRLRVRVKELEAERDHANMVADAAIEELKLRRERKQSRSQGLEG